MLVSFSFSALENLSCHDPGPQTWLSFAENLCRRRSLSLKVGGRMLASYFGDGGRRLRDNRHNTAPDQLYASHWLTAEGRQPIGVQDSEQLQSSESKYSKIN